MLFQINYFYTNLPGQQAGLQYNADTQFTILVAERITILTKVFKHSSGWECKSITLQMTDVPILAVCRKACILMLLSWFKSIKVVLWNKICMNHNVIVGYARC